MMPQIGKTPRSLSVPKAIGLVFFPSVLLTIVYFLSGWLQQSIPSQLLFFLLAMLILFPFELAVVLHESKKLYGAFSLKSAFTHQSKADWKTTLLYGFLLFGFAGIVSFTLQPLEARLTAPLSAWFASAIPGYFDWSRLDILRQYPKGILTLTCVVYVVLNVFIGPVIEELFFRGLLTSRLHRLGRGAPVLVTVLFSLYHLWLPFQNLFRISVFLPAAYLAWRQKNLYISILFHCLCNLFSSIGFLVAVFSVT